MPSQHELFLERLAKSRPGVWAFGYWLNGRGFTIEIPPLEYAPTAAEHRKFLDKGDLFAWDKTRPRLRFEVKTLTCTFSGPGDWPYREVFVASVLSVHRAIGDAYAWVSVSNDLKAAVMIKESTWESWYKRTVVTENTGNEETKYACPLEKVSWIILVD